MFFEEKSVAFHTLGCKLNFAETSTIARQLLDSGYSKLSFHDKASVYIINTCSVTEKADKECKTLVRKALKANPEAFIIVIGCYAQLKPEEISKIPGVSLVLGAQEKFNILDFLEKEKQELQKIHSCEIESVNQYISSYSIGDRTRAFLKVQDGCDYKCTYCTIPLARGISRSDTIENILKQAQKITQEGIKEIVLTGVNIGDYGKGEFGNKKHENTFLDLILALDKVEELERIRISSIEPNLLNDDIIKAVLDSKKFVPHFHIPLQSGSDVILKKMKRRYLTSLYTNRIETIKAIAPHAAIGVDVIVGFPGETEELFLETYNYIKNLDISYLHVFTYSERADTEAIVMKEVVPMQIRKERNRMLRILSEKKRIAFYKSQLHTIQKVLWENKSENNVCVGFTENYIKIEMPFGSCKMNTIENVYLDQINSNGWVNGKTTYEMV